MEKNIFKEMQKSFYSPVSRDEVNKYASIFLHRYKDMWNGINGSFFGIDIYMGKHTVGMNFKVLDKQPEKEINIISFGLDSSEKEVDFIRNKIKIPKNQVELSDFLNKSFYKINHNIRGFWSSDLAFYNISEYDGAMFASVTSKQKEK